MYVAGQMGHADWSMLVKVYGRWIPSGAVTQAGELVAAANINNWGSLANLVRARSNVVPEVSDYEGGGASGEDGDDDFVDLGGAEVEAED